MPAYTLLDPSPTANKKLLLGELSLKNTITIQQHFLVRKKVENNFEYIFKKCMKF